MIPLNPINEVDKESSQDEVLSDVDMSAVEVTR
jgi:hypothetical protein